MDVFNSFVSAVRSNRLHTLTELIDTYGLSDSKPWGNGYELLSIALQRKHSGVAEILLLKGSEVNGNRNTSWYDYTLRFGISDGFSSTPLHLAIINRDIKIVEMILNKKAHMEARDQADRTPLFVAIKNNVIEAVELLLKNGADVNFDSPLHFAISCRNQKIIIMLLEKGADINAFSRKGQTPLQLAIHKRTVEIVITLLTKGADVNALERRAQSPLLLAVQKGYPEIIITLLTKGVVNVNAMGRNGITPLHTAVQKGSKEIVAMLLSNGADVNVKQKGGITPLHLAVEHSHPDIVETLLEFGADFDSWDISGKTAFYDAIEKRYGLFSVNFETLPIKFQYADDNFGPQHKVLKLFLHHIVKLLAANLNVSEQHLKLMGNIVKNKMSDFHSECQEQIANMKREKINNANISFYDILAKNTSSLAIYMRNEGVVQVLKSDDYEKKFPIHASMIKFNFRKGLERKELIEQTNLIFHFFNNFAELPCECTDKIFSYLSNKDIRILINAFKTNNVGTPIVENELITLNISQP